MAILAAAAIGATLFLVVLAFGGGGTTMRSRLDSLRTGAQGNVPEDVQGPSLSQRTMAPMTETLVRMVKRVMPTNMLRNVEERLSQAGEPISVNGFLVLQVLMAGSFLLLPVLVVVAAGMAMGIGVILFIVGFAAIGLLLPQMWLRQRVSQRRNHIIKSLPDAFDLITTCVEAGLGLDGALARVAEKVEGPFAMELSRMLREVGLGKMRREALKELGVRTGVPDLIAFVNAVIQAEEMGSSVGTVLRVQAAQLRVRRRQRAEEQAYKAPIKMIFPLVLCIFPTLFIVILGPAVITILQDFPA